MDKIDHKENRFDYSHFESFFTNIVSVTTNGEDVQIFFGIKEDKNEADDIRVKYRAIMTLPHFLRMHQVFTSLISKMEKDGVVFKSETSVKPN
jgi:hypothetical protein